MTPPEDHEPSAIEPTGTEMSKLSNEDLKFSGKKKNQ